MHFMDLLAAFVLRILHLIYTLTVFLISCWKPRPSPQPLHTARRRIPNHLAILLATNLNRGSEGTEGILVESVVRAVGWCRTVGVQKLTVYDRRGVLLNRAHVIRERIQDKPSDNSNSSESEIEYPLTPPPSDYSESRPLSPQDGLCDETGIITIHLMGQPKWRKSRNPLAVQRKRRVDRNEKPASNHPLTLCLVSRESSKPAIAAATRSLVRSQTRKGRKPTKVAPLTESFQLTVDALDSVLEGENSVSSPDFLFVQSVTPLKHNRTPLELHGFPPWHIRLTEIYHNTVPEPHQPWHQRLLSWNTPALVSPPLDEINFRHALDEFAMAEMRFGK